MDLLWIDWGKHVFILCRQGNIYTVGVETTRSTHRKPELLKVYYIFVTLWGLMGLATVIKAVKAYQFYLIN